MDVNNSLIKVYATRCVAMRQTYPPQKKKFCHVVMMHIGVYMK